MYTVTRQIQWPDGTPMVEVSEGGIDYTNPDALVAKYPGEFQEFRDPREAVETAIKICQAWRKDGEPRAEIGIGATGGCTMPFDSIAFKEAKDWANTTWDKLEKCPTCGKVMEDAKEWWEAGEYLGGKFFSYQDGDKYCSEFCAEKASEFLDECFECKKFFPEDKLEPHPEESCRFICGDCLDKWNDTTVICALCHKPCKSEMAHLHQNDWIGDECCWDDRLHASE